MTEPEDMGAERPRRSKPKDAPEMPSGYRASRRAGRASKQAKRAIRQHKVVSRLDSAGRSAKNIALVVVGVLVVTVAVGLVIVLAATALNGVVRWNTRRTAARSAVPTEKERKAKESLLIISEKDGKATGFLAARVDAKSRQVFGIAIPDGAFIEVPGQGFERVGDSYMTGAAVSLSAISNFLTVPFERYVVVPEAVYQKALRSQSMKGVMGEVSKTNLTDQERADLASTLGTVASKDVALVPLQVKPITVGKQTYFEPQREELADLLKSWWGVEMGDAESATRLIVYNGAGVPGIAGEAAQALIRGGFRVVDTKNADTFGYQQTQIVVQNGDMTAGERVRSVLKVGKVVNQPSDQNVADVIVIVGKDYKPPKTTQ
jgi:hypothetical protein